jgi:CRISPR/Cas system-associated protein Csm6
VSVRFIGRDNVRKRLAQLEGTPGRTHYAGDEVRIDGAEAIVVRPAFGLAHAGDYETVHVEPLLAELAQDHVAKALVEEAADVAAAVLEPYRDRIEFVALGGDRAAVEAALDTRADLAWLRERALPRFFTVADPRRRTLEALPYDLYAAEVREA